MKTCERTHAVVCLCVCDFFYCSQDVVGCNQPPNSIMKLCLGLVVPYCPEAHRLKGIVMNFWSKIRLRGYKQFTSYLQSITVYVSSFCITPYYLLQLTLHLWPEETKTDISVSKQLYMDKIALEFEVQNGVQPTLFLCEMLGMEHIKHIWLE